MQKTLYSSKAEILRSWLKAKRLEQKLSMRALAQRLDVPFQFISKVEKGDRRLDVVEYAQYCASLGIDPQEGLALITDM